jgi:hypothetical protein
MPAFLRLRNDASSVAEQAIVLRSAPVQAEAKIPTRSQHGKSIGNARKLMRPLLNHIPVREKRKAKEKAKEARRARTIILKGKVPILKTVRLVPRRLGTRLGLVRLLPERRRSFLRMASVWIHGQMCT